MTFSSGRRVRQSLTPSPLEGRSALLMGRSAEDGAQPLLASFSTDPGRSPKKKRTAPNRPFGQLKAALLRGSTSTFIALAP